MSGSGDCAAPGPERRAAPDSSRGRSVRAGSLSLFVRSRGHGRPIVILHGFTGSGESMAGVARALADRWQTHCLDLVGHGRSDAPGERAAYSMPNCVEQVLDVLDALSLESPHLLGYSMGARVALSLCVAAPLRFASALLVGASPGLLDPEQRARRVAADEALAARILSEGLEAFVDAWMALPLFAGQRRLGERAWQAARNQRLANRPHALAASLRGMGTGAMAPLHERLSGLPMPICLVSGERDAKFRALAEETASRLVSARVECVADAGHAAHLENPEFFERIARAFFSEVEERSQGRLSAAPARTSAHTPEPFAEASANTNPNENPQPGQATRGSDE